ncbi:MAG: hypothetical protein IPN68_00015 [Bacteroidetes bacterium]|nr:hypothetical protein [Bacteroidota bacterium]
MQAHNIRQQDSQGSTTDLGTDLGAQTDDQTAAEVSFTPGGNLISTDVQSALLELDADKLALAGGTMTGYQYGNE